MTNPHVVIIGAGQLGSRYLQGLARIHNNLEVTVVDTNQASLSLSRKRLEEVQPISHLGVHFSTNLSSVAPLIDLAVVATPAHCRAKLVSEIDSLHNVKAWVLEKVLAQSIEQTDLIHNVLASNDKVWVNTPRRLMTWHQTIRANMFTQGPHPLQIEVNGGSWGLACNSIHFIDLVAWWTNAQVLSVNADSLEEWINSKRPGFKEVLGKLTVNYTDGSVLTLSSSTALHKTSVIVDTQNGRWTIDESAGTATGPFGKTLSGSINLQSEITGPLVSQILQQGTCSLPTLPVAISQYRPFLSALLDHWNTSQKRHDLILPIT